MQADVLVELIRQALAGNRPTIRQSVETLIAGENRKGHRVLAERLHKALQAPETQRQFTAPFAGRSGAAPQQDLYYEIQPERQLDSLLLAPPISAQIRELVAEQQRVELLHAHNLCTRHRVLLAGPPGNGKTSLFLPRQRNFASASSAASCLTGRQPNPGPSPGRNSRNGSNACSHTQQPKPRVTAQEALPL